MEKLKALNIVREELKRYSETEHEGLPYNHLKKIENYLESSLDFDYHEMMRLIESLYSGKLGGNFVYGNKALTALKEKLKLERKNDKTYLDGYLYLDDVRCSYDSFYEMQGKFDNYQIYEENNKWKEVTSYGKFIKEIQKSVPKFISFDYDLDDNFLLRSKLPIGLWFNEKENRSFNGLDCAKFLTKYCFNTNTALPEYTVHSSNPEGTKLIFNHLSQFSNCKKCNSIFEKEEVARIYGRESSPYKLSFCSSRCYTQSLMPDEETLKKSREDYESFMKEYRRLHAACPKCNATQHTSTLVGYIMYSDRRDEYKDLNRCDCKGCGDKHTYHERVPIKN